eukprot:sb/3473436/
MHHDSGKPRSRVLDDLRHDPVKGLSLFNTMTRSPLCVALSVSLCLCRSFFVSLSLDYEATDPSPDRVSDRLTLLILASPNHGAYLVSCPTANKHPRIMVHYISYRVLLLVSIPESCLNRHVTCVFEIHIYLKSLLYVEDERRSGGRSLGGI